MLKYTITGSKMQIETLKMFPGKGRYCAKHKGCGQKSWGFHINGIQRVK